MRGAAAAYEELRSHILAGWPGGQHFGLILRLREGVAAWVERGPASSSIGPRPATADHPARAWPGSEPLHAEMARVLAGIVLNRAEEARL